MQAQDSPRPFSRRSLGITAKLFLAILAVCCIVAVGMVIATRVSFHTGFLDYLSDLEQERLTALADVLGDDYSQKGNWDFLRNDPKAWRKLVGRHIRQDPIPKKKSPPDEAEEAERARRSWQTAHLRSSLGLMTADKKTLAAGTKPSAGAFWQPITADSDEIVGWLTRDPPAGVTEAVDVRFQEQQTKAGLLIAGLSLLLAAAASIVSARTLIAPLRRLADTTNQLAAGNLAARAELQTGDELHTLAHHLNQLAQTLQRNESSRRTFMAEISHDLRTPLAILRGELEALEDGVRPVTPASLASLKAEVGILTRLVDDIHTLSLTDLGTLAYEKVATDLGACLTATLAVVRERFTAQGLTVDYTPSEEPLPVLADVGRLGQVLHNVLENSLRYTDPGGVVQIRCHRDGSTLFLDVLDSAPGVPENRLEAVFERFHTGDGARNRKNSGSGLGLAICRSMIEAHGGAMRALPSPLGGLWIRIALPQAETEQNTP